MTESFSKEQDADLLFYQNGLLKKEIERLKALLTEAAAELSVACHDQYPTRASYPDEMRRWKRDMDLVNRIREALGGD